MTRFPTAKAAWLAVLLTTGMNSGLDLLTAAEVAAPATAAAPAAVTALPPLRDPLKPMNVAFYHFNDKLYFWVLKPMAQGYQYVVPETGRVWVRNFFTNLNMPTRFVNCVLQLNARGASTELERFGINTTVGILGFSDPAFNKWQIAPYKEDFGYTLGYYGTKPWIYLHWPIFGPSNPRDTVGLVADSFTDPLGYLLKMPPRVGVKAYDKVNGTSLVIGEYEDLKEAALDPYVAVRDAYYQYREKTIRNKRAAISTSPADK